MSRDENADERQVNADKGSPSSVSQETTDSSTSRSPAADDTPQRTAVPEGDHSGEKLGAFFGGLIPVVISFLFHLGLLLIMLFAVFLTEVEIDTEKLGIIDDAFIDETQRLAPPRTVLKKKVERKSMSRKPPVAGDIQTKAKVHIGRMSSAFDENAADLEGLPGQAGGQVEFFGTKPVGDMRHVVYVIDRSGSMVGYFPDVIGELCRSLAKLDGNKQSYHVILFAEGKPLEKNPPRLTPATRRNARQTAMWLEKDITCGGTTKAIPALQRAFDVLKGSRGGRVIYLLTDGSFKDAGGNEKVLGYIKGKNKDRKVHITTFLYGTKPKLAVEVMKKIAEQNGGWYQYVESN